MAKAKPRRAHQKPRRKGGWVKKILLGMLTLFLLLALMGVGAFIYLFQTTDIPDPNEDFQTNTTFIHYAGGEQMGSLAIQNRETLEYEDIPQVMKDAAIAAENRSFWTDPGISVPGIMRAAWTIARGGELQGGSTITQQYIKILYLDSEQTLNRKVRELILAIKMDQSVAKEEILAGYLNTIYFGRGAYGIQAASKSFFLKPAKDLAVEEAAALAAILNNPTGFNPSGGEEHRERLFERYQYVLDGMLETGTISEEDYTRAYPQLPEFPEVPKNDRYGGTKGYLIKQVEEELEQLGFDQAQVQGGGLKVTTTIDKRLQEHAKKVVEEAREQAVEAGREGANIDDLHIALASIDTETGGILAIHGGEDYLESQINWARTPRPAASTYKAFALAAGLRQGFALDDVFNGNSFTPKGEEKPVNNQGKQQYGPLTLRRATALSSNTAFVHLTEQMEDGNDSVVQAAQDAGAPDVGWKPHARVALGFNQVSPVNIANSYATFANGGVRNKVHIVSKVVDRKGEVLHDASKEKGEQTIEPDVAALTTEALQGVVKNGTGREAQKLGYPVAGKTGTNGMADGGINAAWFQGMTKQVSTAVMYVAGDGGVSDLTPYRQPGTRTFFGSGYPLDTWLAYMETAMEGLPKEDFDEPTTNRVKKSKKPKPVEETTRQQPSSDQDPEPGAEAPAPKPKVTKPVETSEPEPTTQAPEPEPTTQAPEPEPVTREPEPQPTQEDPPLQEPPAEEPPAEEPPAEEPPAEQPPDEEPPAEEPPAQEPPQKDPPAKPTKGPGEPPGKQDPPPPAEETATPES